MPRTSASIVTMGTTRSPCAVDNLLPSRLTSMPIARVRTSTSSEVLPLVVTDFFMGSFISVTDSSGLSSVTVYRHWAKTKMCHVKRKYSWFVKRKYSWFVKRKYSWFVKRKYSWFVKRKYSWFVKRKYSWFVKRKYSWFVKRKYSWFVKRKYSWFDTRLTLSLQAATFVLC